MTDVVISKYKEDISWVKNITKSKLFIYDKSDDVIPGHIKLPNIGREAHTYLYHIINNYDNLSDYTCFLQGNPYDKEKGHLSLTIEQLESFSENIEFYPLSYILECNLDGTPHHPNLDIDKIIFDKFFIDKPDTLKFVVGAQFIVSKKSILSRKKEFYIDILKEFDRIDIDNEHTGGGGGTKGNKMPWICERIWAYLFISKFRTNYDVNFGTNIYINIAMVGSVNQVLWDLLTRIKQSGLYDAANKIYLVFNGDRKHLAFNLVSDKYVIIDANPDISKCEFPTLDLICEHCKEEDLNVLYLHTKGVTKPGYQQIIDWTNLLSHFNINKWEDRLKDLKENDCSGINFFGNPNDINEHPSTWGYGKAPLHYSGNFWWSKSSHIRKLPNMSNWLPDGNYLRWRVMAEMWICQIQDGKYFTAFSSDVDHYQNLYPRELYEKSV